MAPCTIKKGWNWKFRCISTWNVDPIRISCRCECHCMGTRIGETNNDL